MYAERVPAALDEFVDLLVDAGVAASLDRAKVQTPGALVAPQSVNTLTLDDSGRLRVWVYLIAPSTEPAPFPVLWGLLDKCLQVLDPDEPVDTSYAVSLPRSATTTFPAFRLVVDLDI